MFTFGSNFGLAKPLNSIQSSFYRDALQYNNGQNDGSVLLDKTPNDYTLEPRNGAVLEFDGVGDLLTVTGLTASDTVTCEGTATPTAGTDQITFTAGTAYQISINGELVYPCAESSGTTLFSITDTWPDAEITSTSGITTMRAARGPNYANYWDGFSKVLSFNGVDAYVDCGKPANTSGTNIDIEACFKTDDVGNFKVVAARRSSALDAGFVLGKDNNNRIYGQVSPTGLAVNNITITDTTGTLTTDGQFHTARLVLLGGTLELFVDGSSVGTGSVASAFDTTSNMWLGWAGGGYFEGFIAYCFIRDSAGDITVPYYAANAYGTTLPDSTGTNDATLTNTEFLYIPALDDGTDDAASAGLTNKGAEKDYSLINWEGDLVQTSGQEAALGHSGLWYEADGTTEKDVSYADALAWLSGEDNTFLDFYTDDNGVCVGRFNLVYADDKMFTPSEYQRIANRYPNECGAGILVPAEVTAGTGIGPNGEWADNGDGKVLLVEDA